jgi:membrane protein DedA with SNARE-associated domain
MLDQLAKISFPQFFFATFFGAYIWCTLFIGVGYLLGHEWMLISDNIKTHVPLVTSLAVMTAAVYITWRFHERILTLVWTKTRKLDNKKL